jgi:hypothetical protein
VLASIDSWDETRFDLWISDGFMKAIRYITAAVLVILSFTRLPAKADLYPVDDLRWGTGSLTLDTRTGLTWLDLPFSLDLSYSQAEAEMLPGGEFAGFRHATAVEVASLYASAGFGEGFIPAFTAGSQDVVSLISLIGATGGTDTAGITGSLDSHGLALLAYLNNVSINSEPGYFVTATAGTSYGLDTHYDDVGNWLVAVPEPSTCSLLLLGVALALYPRARKA